MISNKKTIAVSAIAVAAVTLVFAATPLIVAYVQSHEAQAFFMGGFHNRGFFGFHNRFFGGGFRNFGFGGGWGGGWGGWGGGCGGWGGCGGCGGWGW
jgi:hypothetical protein